jgi:hypothetical protein
MKFQNISRAQRLANHSQSHSKDHWMEHHADRKEISSNSQSFRIEDNIRNVTPTGLRFGQRKPVR